MISVLITLCNSCGDGPALEVLVLVFAFQPRNVARANHTTNGTFRPIRSA